MCAPLPAPHAGPASLNEWYLALESQFRHHQKVLAHAITPRYTNYTFVSSYGAITDDRIR